MMQKDHKKRMKTVKVWLKLHKKKILYPLLFGWFVFHVLIIPSLRPLVHETYYYVTYTIDSYNIGDALIWYPILFFAMGIICTALRCSRPFSALLFCFYAALPVLVRRTVCWGGVYPNVNSAVLFYAGIWLIGMLFAVAVKRTFACIQKSWRRYQNQKSGVPDGILSAETEKIPCKKRIRMLMTRDTMYVFLSMALPLMFFVLYSAKIAETTPVSIAQDEVDMTYMLLGLPLGYLVCGGLYAQVQHPHYITCGAILILLSLDTVLGVFDIMNTDRMWVAVIASVVYLLFYIIGIVVGWLFYMCFDEHRKNKRNQES